MEANEVRLNFITKSILQYFKFLFDKGFRISKASNFLESLGSWFIEFESSKCFLLVLSDRDEVTVRIYPIKANRKIVIGLKTMIFYLSSGRTLIGYYEGNGFWGTKKQLQDTSSLLKEYIDQIVQYMGDDFQKISDEYKSASEKYLAIQISSYRKRNLR